jgi:hypothetical protein
MGAPHDARASGRRKARRVEILVRAVAGLLLAAHGGVHALYLIPEPEDPAFPFTLDGRSPVPQPARRAVAVALVAATVVASLLLALAVWGVPGLAGAWPGLAIAAAACSLVLLAAFWDRRLVAGVAIDAAMIAVAVVQPGWTDAIG